MSRLGELVRELCPDGVEYKKLGDCCILEKGATPIQKAVPGEYPLVVTTEERKSSNTYQFDGPTVCIPLVSSRGHGVACLNQIYYQEGKFALGNILCGVTPKDSNELSASFLYHYLNYKKDTLIVPLMKGGANVSLTVDSLKRVKVPVPPIEIQHKKIQKLDSFIALITELKAELAARKKQYEYYRELLLTFDDASATLLTDRQTDRPVRWLMLNEVADMFRGEYITKKNAKDGNIPVILGGQEPAYYIDRFNHDGEIVVIARSGVSAGFVSYWNEPIFVTDGFGFEAKDGIVIPKYLYYVLKNIERDLNAMKRGAGVPHVSGEVLEQVLLPVPSIKMQQCIISVLDCFDALCNDLTSGLPAEIEARRKQYEYYRDKLLTFKEASA